MTTTPAPVSSFESSFDVLTGPSDDPLLTSAAAATTRAVDDASQGVLVVVLRPGADDVQVISGGGTGVLRAAVSVAVAAGNDRLWREAPHGDTVECSVRALPEVIAAAAEAGGVRSVHTGCIRRGEELDAVAVWFETWNGVAGREERRRTLDDLEHAALIAAEHRAMHVAEEATAAVVVGPRTWDAEDPRLDASTGTLTAEAFADAVDEFDGDEATMLVIDLDGFSEVAATWGTETSDAVLRTVVDRLLGSLRRGDLVARIEHDRFAVLLGEADRSSVMQIGKCILNEIAEPLPSDLGPTCVTATVALAHQSGLVDLEDMFDSALAAVASGKRSGTGRLVLAA
jgi:diguanylate cyclase (GGDEF)-like protein